MNPDVKKAIQWLASKLFSRKLLVWTVATVAFFMLLLPAQYWFIISLVYLGAVSILDYNGLQALGSLLKDDPNGPRPPTGASEAPPAGSPMSGVHPQ